MAEWCQCSAFGSAASRRDRCESTPSVAQEEEKRDTKNTAQQNSRTTRIKQRMKGMTKDEERGNCARRRMARNGKRKRRRRTRGRGSP